MNKQGQKIAIAAACGTHKILVDEPNHLEVQDINGLVAVYESSGFSKPFPYIEPLDYLNDLNAMHKAEKYISDYRWPLYVKNLKKLVRNGVDESIEIHATAAQRAEAFIKTLNLTLKADCIASLSA